ncbi:ubiquitin carboxyl-terminal hydrolase 50 isoform X4 [Pseudorasbora parva]|uniref:ubiquitin carboxyl-terminal hydrolase 50 isoform X4 n=1 Tax=Pseudorasbora parva TaxID=51549 RepID=UPI00351F13EC
MKNPDTLTAPKISRESPDRNEVQYNGLKNQGATCYLNAVLQCLFMTPVFREAVKSFKAPEDCDEENLLLQLQKLFTRLSENAATTKGITTSLGIRNVFEQQDAVEYYRKILKAVGTHASKVFEGKMNNITKCNKCCNKTTETNTFISILLSIDVVNDKKYDMKKSLKTFFEHSILEKDDWMYCEGCDRKTETETWSEIAEYPTVLTLHLKRFDFDYLQMRYKKNECHLDVPLSLPNEDNRPGYELYAVINHTGGYSSGHYDTIIRSYENGKWYRFDDYNVTRSSEASLQNSSLPYMLMYRKSLSPDCIKTTALNPGSIKTTALNPDCIKTTALNPDCIKTTALNPDCIKTTALNPGSIPYPLKILLVGPSRAGKSTVGNIILGGNYFPSKSGPGTVTKESMVKTVKKVTVVDTPNLFSLNKSSWATEMQKCFKLSDPGPNVILWVTPISKFSEQQQGLFHTFKKRLDSETKKRMMIIFTKGRELKKLGQPIDRFISDHRKLRKVVSCCQNRYHVIDINDGHNYTSDLLKKLMDVASKKATPITQRQFECLRRRQKNIKATIQCTNLVNNDKIKA